MFNRLMATIEARPANFGPMNDANAHAKVTGPCGDTVEVWLRVDGGKIRQASFLSDGCGHSVHCCAVAVKLAEGMRPEEAAGLTQEQVLAATGPVPEDHRHCALLAANTIRHAIANLQPAPAKIALGQRIRRFFNQRNKEQQNV